MRSGCELLIADIVRCENKHVCQWACRDALLRATSREIHDALRKQHPEWIKPNGDCPTCDSYESRFAELLNLFQASERKSSAA
jgi:hypothetical protein